MGIGYKDECVGQKAKAKPEGTQPLENLCER